MITITVFLLLFLSRVQMVNTRDCYNLGEKVKKYFSLGQMVSQREW